MGVPKFFGVPIFFRRQYHRERGAWPNGTRLRPESKSLSKSLSGFDYYYLLLSNYLIILDFDPDPDFDSESSLNRVPLGRGQSIPCKPWKRPMHFRIRTLPRWSPPFRLLHSRGLPPAASVFLPAHAGDFFLGAREKRGANGGAKWRIDPRGAPHPLLRADDSPTRSPFLPRGQSIP